MKFDEMPLKHLAKVLDLRLTAIEAAIRPFWTVKSAKAGASSFVLEDCALLRPGMTLNWYDEDDILIHRIEIASKGIDRLTNTIYLDPEAYVVPRGAKTGDRLDRFP